MTSITRETLDRLEECAAAINLHLTFWFDTECFHTEEEALEILQYCEAGEFADFTDTCVDELIGLIHTEFFDPPHQSPLATIDKPVGINLDTGISYE
jgi:hypothetical protein|tara:strand:- start:78 stop:368 length:291 start_codon:yes stop_codon:yes gene_type:complete